jgi:type IV pilus assembly protein PilY1
MKKSIANLRWPLIALALACPPLAVHPEDIDLFVGNSGTSSGNPNILIVLDNTSNWARQSQQWPGGEQQGQSEVAAIKSVFSDVSLTGVNVGLMEFVTNGNANENGGFIRYPISPLTDTSGDKNKAQLAAIMDTIYGNINGTTEKRNSNTPYGNLMYDTYNYFAGVAQSQSGGGTLGSLVENGYSSNADGSTANIAGYSTQYTTFKSPLSCATGCANNYIIFISNPNQSGPAADDSTNTTALRGLGSTLSPSFDSAAQLPLSNYVATVSSTTTSTNNFSSSQYRNTTNDLNACSTAANTDLPTIASEYTDGLICAAPIRNCTSGANPKCEYTIYGKNSRTAIEPTGTATTDTNPFNADEWARFMFQKGVPVSSCDRQTVATYTVDVFNAQPNAQHTGLMKSMAVNGGGDYFAARNKDQLITALKDIVRKILSKNSTFASASLPINATNRSQNANQVYIGMFRPDQDTKPRWLGNLKRYQIINDATLGLTLGDVLGQPAINTGTGFIDDCAASWYTIDSGDYWWKYWINKGVSQIAPDPKSLCSNTTYTGLNAYSDLPDGPRVEKGSVAEIIRQGNNPSATASWVPNRNIKSSISTATTAIEDFNTSKFNTTINAALTDTLIKWTSGYDTENEAGLATPDPTKTRASLHGDVVHSRPLPVNYSTKNDNEGLVTYYGANDGTFRAVDSVTGRELWSYVAPEFFPKLDRLRTGSPLIAYSGRTTGATPTPTPKDYFFDGSIGLYQNADNSQIWIYPTMRRGGRMLYAFDVSGTATTLDGKTTYTTPPKNPTIKWKFGCPNLGDDNNCTGSDWWVKDIGQTWSMPKIAYIKDDSLTRLVAIVGGGYDTCEDRDQINPCSDRVKGNKVYVLDAETGVVLKYFTTRNSVIADVALVDVNNDGFVDYGYVGDTGGNLYRLSFSSYQGSKSYSYLPKDQWKMSLVSYTRGAGRKFQFQPSLFFAQDTVYVALGSGDRERPLLGNYPYTRPVSNRFYVYRDCLSRTRDYYSYSYESHSDSLSTSDDLDGIKMTATSAVDTPTCTGSPTLPGNCDTNNGWYLDLNNGRGEQTVTSSVISGGLIAFSTNRAVPPGAGSQVCTPLGEARGYWLNLFNGAGAIGVDGICGDLKDGKSTAIASTPFVGGGLPPSPVVGVVPVDGVMTNIIIGAVNKSGTGVSTAISPQQAKSNIPPFRRKVYDYVKGLN